MTTLFDPVNLGDTALANRIIMAPMTRSRAGPGDVPTSLMADYYRQRASAGLIITEGTQPSAEGKGYLRTPGIHSADQISGWRDVTDAVHAEGGRIFLQIMHCGRIASGLNKDPAAQTVAPSAIRARGEIMTEQGMMPFDEPVALETRDIPRVIREFADAARNAVAAGFDGVELHCTSGYLPAQFLSSGSNHRTDGYGGSSSNRIRFVVESLEAMAAAIGAGRVGFRICPGNPFNDIWDEDPAETYGALLRAVSPLDLAYVHLIDVPSPQVSSLNLLKHNWRGRTVLNESLSRKKAEELISGGVADAVSFGRPFIGNPDLVERFRNGAALASFDPATLYTPGPEGYVDYPALVAVN
ncbi:alkene reductase [Croceicoccus sp. F390]|uniref:Alkene reductase n=1 Tax=Croceicoccus esteveae TaxID=3075597 RepID=A0ABU2ZKJ5_9SPHN|nr:alkene reductase [Croceicoccus sp. F390]MDT0577134.1 alkene reductase [Croceicoccus sp. F390]